MLRSRHTTTWHDHISVVVRCVLLTRFIAWHACERGRFICWLAHGMTGAISMVAFYMESHDLQFCCYIEKSSGKSDGHGKLDDYHVICTFRAL